MVKEYIEREAIEQIIASACGECADTCLEFDGIQPDCNQCLLSGVVKAVKALPAADVRPNVRGEWMKRRFSDNCVGYECLNCHTTWDAPTNFCPNCGCAMGVDN